MSEAEREVEHRSAVWEPWADDTMVREIIRKHYGSLRAAKTAGFSFPAGPEIPAWVTEGIEKALNPKPTKRANPARYPYTYAYDFLRSHAAEFGIEDASSRAATSLWLRRKLGVTSDSEEVHRAVCEELADAYLREHGMVIDL